jgi:hypothetical protein
MNNKIKMAFYNNFYFVLYNRKLQILIYFFIITAKIVFEKHSSNTKKKYLFYLRI